MDMNPTSFSDVPKVPKNADVRGDYIDDILESQPWSREAGQQQVIRAGERDTTKKVTWE